MLTGHALVAPIMLVSHLGPGPTQRERERQRGGGEREREGERGIEREGEVVIGRGREI